MRSKMPGKRLLDVMAFMPHTVPSIMIALAMIYLFLTVPWRMIPIYGTVWIIFRFNFVEGFKIFRVNAFCFYNIG